jgi:hypothetical protein
MAVKIEIEVFWVVVPWKALKMLVSHHNAAQDNNPEGLEPDESCLHPPIPFPWDTFSLSLSLSMEYDETILVQFFLIYI